MRFTTPTILAACLLAASPFVAATAEWTSSLRAAQGSGGPRGTLTFAFSGPLVAGQPVQFSATGAVPGNMVQFVGSTTGGGPFNVPGIGVLDVTPPVYVSPPFPIDAGGSFSFTTTVPLAFAGGNFWGNVIEWDAAVAVVQGISPGVSEAIQ